MRNFKTLMALYLILASIVGASETLAGSCSSGNAGHAHAQQAAVKESIDTSTMAIYPLAKEAGFTTLTAAVEAAGLDGALSAEGPYTVFAPTDEAFAKLPEGTVESLLANPEALKKVLLYHVVSGDVRAAQVVELDSATTLNGEMVAINTDGGVRVNDANVIKTDITASNGVVHVIDTVLIPENL
jgi:uncharacterized surface protein with fasciclin (FAS1) repeats